ncbi:MAG: DUF255 domain-containing protein [Paraperlucidibaca sp.]
MRAVFSLPAQLRLPMAFGLLFLTMTAGVFSALASAQAATASLPASIAKLPSGDQPQWLDWSEAVFAAAKAQDKLVILDVAAVWCHWCHVMDEKTYADKDIRALLAKDFLSVRVDYDQRPELGLRFQDYGWPATIIFNANADVLAKRAGYIDKDELLGVLNGLVKNPVAEEAKARPIRVATSPQLSATLRTELQLKHSRSYDSARGGLRQAMKYLERDSVEYTLLRAQQGDKQQAAQAQQTLTAALALQDPVWGGFYQYSTHGDWQHPHVEKIMAVQAGYLRLYALATAQWGTTAYANAAQKTVSYLQEFLRSPDGAFYSSQDADVTPGQHSVGYYQLGDVERRKQGIPAIDKRIYPRENGWAIEALATWAMVSGDAQARAMAVKAAQQLIRQRAKHDGHFQHEDKSSSNAYLGDQLAMARAMLALYSLTGERSWLEATVKTSDFILREFSEGSGGFRTHQQVSAVDPAYRQTGENISVARHLNLLAHYSAMPRFKQGAERAMRYLATPALTAGISTEAGVLIADSELASDPLHMTVVSLGDTKQSSKALGLERKQAKALLAVALKQQPTYQRVEWWQKNRGPLLDATVTYPALAQPAGFVCSASRCSLPATTPERFQQLIDQLTQPTAN